MALPSAPINTKKQLLSDHWEFALALRYAYTWLLQLVFGENAPLFFQNRILQFDQDYMGNTRSISELPSFFFHILNLNEI